MPDVPAPAGPPFRVDVVAAGGGTVVRAAGELDMATADQLHEGLKEAERAGGAIEVDLSQVTFMDSTGLRILIVAREAAGAAERDFAVVPSAAVRKVLTVVGLTDFIPLRGGDESDGSRAA